MDFSGNWHGYYRYPSDSRGDDFWGEHILHATQAGNSLRLESDPGTPDHAILELELDAEGKMARGVWRGQSDPKGYYKGAEYEGTIELTIAADGHRMNGVWHGRGKDGKLESDIWELVREEKTVEPTALPKNWKFTYWYPGADDESKESTVYSMKAYQNGPVLVLESQPTGDGSYMLVRLRIQDDIAAGGWYEQSSPEKEYRGAQYSGAGQMIVDPKTRHMEGLWAGAGYDRKLKKMRIYTGRWQLDPARES